jgi:formylglycine-generating enzyme required for sulfatase activity
MSRFLSLLLISCLAYISPLSAQKGCCDDSFNQGTAAFKAKNYDLAIRLFNQGNDCSSNCTHNFYALIVQAEEAERAAGIFILRANGSVRLDGPPPSIDSSPKDRNIDIIEQAKPAQAPSTPSLSRFSFEPQMVKVEGGTFQMGNNENELEKPMHSVTVSDFYIGKYEVTHLEWQSVMEGEELYYADGTGSGRIPANDLSLDEVNVFLKKLNEKTGKKYRLPTENEWEFAARGGNNSKGYTYSGSNDVNDVAWVDEKEGIEPHVGGGKKANELGIYDMSGNVGEWCQDVLNVYKGSNSTIGFGDYDFRFRVHRGGGWKSDAYGCRSSYRGGEIPESSGDLTLGFRLVISSF